MKRKLTGFIAGLLAGLFMLGLAFFLAIIVSARNPSDSVVSALAGDSRSTGQTNSPDVSPVPGFQWVQTVSFTTSDHIQLKATYSHPPDTSSPAPALLLLHMAYTSKDIWAGFARTAQEAGYAVLAVDLRGHGESSGEKQFTPVLDKDVDAALDWLIAQPEVDSDRLGLAGASLGANLALRAGARHPNIKAVALLSPGLNYWQVSSQEAMKDYGPRPVLLVASADDQYAADSAQQLDTQARGSHELHIYPGDGHGTELLERQDSLRPLLLAWFDDILSPTPGTAHQNGRGPVIQNVEVVSSAPVSPATVRAYEKFELSFDVDTVAKNLQWPYDAAPPPGIEPGLGISVDALFTPDQWQTVYTQPAFYYQAFDHKIKNGQDWLYPTSNFSWRVRFTPNRPGLWQFKLVAQDAGGASETPPQTFTVAAAASKGFVRVSPTDPRYFEFDNGELFLGLGYNLTFAQPDWINPTTANEPLFQELQKNNLEFFRIWLSHWGIFSSAWNPWNSPDPRLHTQYIPATALSTEEALPESEVSMVLDAGWNRCMFIGAWKAKPAVKKNTTYRVRIRHKTNEINGPQLSGQPYGFVAKIGGWLGDDQACDKPGTGQIVTGYSTGSSASWSILEGKLTTGNQDFLPNFYLALENVDSGKAFIDYVWIEEDLGNGQYGPNIVSKPWMAHHLYFEQRNSYAFDKMLELAEKYGIYLKIVIMEKNEWILNRIDHEGHMIAEDQRCWDDDTGNNPARCPGNSWFYGRDRQMTKVRWLQQSWWRYLQARWGYSPHLHSWELLNEGDPWNSAHYALADEFGRYMHQFAPNDHLVTTSFWHSFPGPEFWANPDYPHLDYADLHAYALEETDAAENSRFYSEKYGALQPQGANKPLVRGETGFNDAVLHDKKGVWLHNYIWAGLNPGGMYEQYWFSKEHIQRGANDLRYHYQPFKNFMDGIPLNNGYYQGIQATSTHPNLRILGQQDLTHQKAHLWIQHKDHTWKKVSSDKLPAPVSGEVTISGFEAGQTYSIEWWDPYQSQRDEQISRIDTVTARSNGSLTVAVKGLVTDVAVKIVPTDQ